MRKTRLCDRLANISYKTVSAATAKAIIMAFFGNRERASFTRQMSADHKGNDYEIVAIIDHDEPEPGELVFRIKWRGYDERYNSWEPLRMLDNCGEMLRAYRDEKGLHFEIEEDDDVNSDEEIDLSSDESMHSTVLIDEELREGSSRKQIAVYMHGLHEDVLSQIFDLSSCDSTD